MFFQSTAIVIQSDRTYHESGNPPGSLNRSAEHLPKHFPVIRRRKNGLYSFYKRRIRRIV